MPNYYPLPAVVIQAQVQTTSGSVNQPAGSVPFQAGDYIVTSPNGQRVVAGDLFPLMFDTSNDATE